MTLRNCTVSPIQLPSGVEIKPNDEIDVDQDIVEKWLRAPSFAAMFDGGAFGNDGNGASKKSGKSKKGAKDSGTESEHPAEMFEAV